MRIFSGLVLIPALMTTMTFAQTGSLRATAAESHPDATRLESLAARFAPTPMRLDLSRLLEGNRKALPKLIEAARIIDDVFLDQYWSGNRSLYQRLQGDTSAAGRARLRYFHINKSPWDELGEFKAFLPGVPQRKQPGSNFYPEDMTKSEFERWVAGLPAAERAKAESFFTLIRRGPGRKLTALPYSEAYSANLTRAADLLREAASLTENVSLRHFLNLRADAFLSNDYYASDIAWMDLDAPLDVTIGPYETYNDELFGYKAAFESYINLRDEDETARLAAFAAHLQEIEDNLPEDPSYRNPRLGGAAPIRVVNQIFCSGHVL
jgi:hypothetical protein